MNTKIIFIFTVFLLVGTLMTNLSLAQEEEAEEEKSDSTENSNPRRSDRINRAKSAPRLGGSREPTIYSKGVSS